MNMPPIPKPILLKQGLTSLALLFLLLAGCAPVKTEPEQPKPSPSADPYARTDLVGLLEFAAILATNTSTERAETCQVLLSRQKEAPGAGVQLHLLAGRLLSDACGDIPKILEAVEAIPADSLPDEPLRHWVFAQKETLKRLLGLSKKLAVLGRKQKPLQNLPLGKASKHPGRKPMGATASADGDARLLRDKLEAIRAMEMKLDESGGGN